MKQIRISDVTMKQSGQGLNLSFREKIELCKLLDKLGVSIIELEGITNARRHGKATKVTVTCGLEPGRFYIIIADNGQGCAAPKQGFGLRHMEERLELLHGRLRYWSDKGFTLEATIPMGKNVMDNHGEDSE